MAPHTINTTVTDRHLALLQIP